ncbi:hypothetical protein [uncultured Ottowia sp.]|uniref:hypothetical protein n=1 Tax=uncultured Ottowia sp. TaxID=543067 RepID=UPI0025931533|nr:hypothetical protein [uncultured Ottowia sp.]
MSWFDNVAGSVRGVQDHVKDLQEGAVDRAQQMAEKAATNIQQMLSKLPHLMYTGKPPEPVKAAPFTASPINLPDLQYEAFGTVSPVPPIAFSLGSLPEIPPLQVDEFRPAVGALSLPPAPPSVAPPAQPGRPALDSVTIPPAPSLQRPPAPRLVDIQVPEFVFPSMPEFTAQEPQFAGSAISVVLSWVETPYRVAILDEQMQVLRRMWSGGLGLPPAVERALWERAAGREDVAAQREAAQAMTEFSGRGYTLPPGALLARVDDVRQQAALRKISLGREVLLKIADVQVENLRFACSQAIAAEQVLVSIWNASAERALQAARAQVDSELALLNAQVAIFNARQSAYATAAQVYKARLEGALARVQAYKTQLDAALAKGQINEQAVRIFEAMQRAMLSDVEVYKARMDGARLLQEVQKGRIDMYRADIQAWAESLQARKIDYDVYKTRVEGETAKAQMLEAQARAYAAYVQGKSQVAEVGIKNQQAAIAREELRLKEWQGRLDHAKAILQHQVAVVQANAEAHRTNTQRVVASAQAQATVADAKIRAHEAALRTNIAMFEAAMRRYMADQEQMVTNAKLQTDVLKSAAQMLSTMAAGAMAGINISASVAGNASISGNGSSSDSLNRNYNYNGEI